MPTCTSWTPTPDPASTRKHSPSSESSVAGPCRRGLGGGEPVTRRIARSMGLREGELQRMLARGRGSPLAPLLLRAEVDHVRAGAWVLTAREDLGLLHLLGSGGRQARDEEDPARRLEVGEPVHAPVDELLGEPVVGPGARHRHDAGHHLFFADLVWHREDRDLGHGLVGLEGRLHLGGGDVLARAPDDVLLAVDEIEHAVFGLPHDVARVEPAAAPRLLGRLRVLEVAREESPSGVRAGAAHDEFALRPAGDLTVTLVHHPRLELPPGPAEGARRRLSRIVAVAEDPPGLGHRSEEHTSELQSLAYLVCRLLLEKKKKQKRVNYHDN